jgi:hypothetical protein
VGKNERRRWRRLNPNAGEGGASMPGGGHLAPGGQEGGGDLLRCDGEAWERQGEERVLKRLL